MQSKLRLIGCTVLAIIVCGCAALPPDRPTPAAATRKLTVSFFAEDRRTAIDFGNIPYDPDESFRLRMMIDGIEFMSGRVTSDGHDPVNVVSGLPQGTHVYRIEIFDPDDVRKVLASGEASLPEGGDLWVAVRLWSDKLLGVLEKAPNPNPKPTLKIDVGDNEYNNYFF